MPPLAEPSRNHQPTPDDLVTRLLTIIRGQFCGDMTQKEWHQTIPFLKRRAILWPARFISGKGFTLPAPRYEAIMFTIFQGIKRHGQTDHIYYWPAYLSKCIQDHWRHHWEEYYAEAKSSRSLADAVLLACKQLPKSDPTITALALAHRVLTDRTSHRNSHAKPSQQLGFPNL